MRKIRRYIPVLTGIAGGALAGFLYWKFIGCASGSCAITSNPWNSTVYGAVWGGLLLSVFQKKQKTTA